MKTKQSINIMLQKWINPVKVPVSTFYIITFMNCSLISRRSLIWVNTRTQTNKPWNWSTCWCAESLFSKTLQGHQLKPREQHWFQSGKTPTCSPAPQWPGPCLVGSTDNTTNYPSWKHRGRYLVADCCWRGVMAGRPWPVTATPIFIHTDTRACCSWCSEHYLGSAVW